MFQGEIEEKPDFIKMSAEDFRESVNNYFTLIEEIDGLERERKNEIERIKEEYRDKISAKKNDMKDIEPCVKSGFKKEMVGASWERDVYTEMMILIRRDTLKPLLIREMTPDEKSKNDLFDSESVPEEEEYEVVEA